MTRAAPPKTEPEPDGGVGDRAQVGLEEHAAPARGELGDDPLLDGARGSLEQRQQPQQQGELPRGPGQDGQGAGQRGAHHADGQHPPRAVAVAEVAGRDLHHDAHQGGHREGEGDLGRGEADLPGEVEGAGRHHGAGAEAVGERAEGQDPQVALQRDAAPGQRWRRLVVVIGSPREHRILMSRYMW